MWISLLFTYIRLFCNIETWLGRFHRVRWSWAWKVFVIFHSKSKKIEFQPHFLRLWDARHAPGICKSNAFRMKSRKNRLMNDLIFVFIFARASPKVPREPKQNFFFQAILKRGTKDFFFNLRPLQIHSKLKTFYGGSLWNFFGRFSKLLIFADLHSKLIF